MFMISSSLLRFAGLIRWWGRRLGRLMDAVHDIG